MDTGNRFMVIYLEKWSDINSIKRSVHQKLRFVFSTLNTLKQEYIKWIQKTILRRIIIKY